ncbi:MAG: cytochrome C [Burkholderiales bacterium PBB5]|nr:MAG: cytochrome C [Burkholderiales bacterium PBB5]
MSRTPTLALAALMTFVLQAPARAADTAAADGLVLFNQVCAACHQPGGKGMAGLAPPLAGTLAPLLARDEGRRYLAQVLVHGLSGRIVSQGQVFNLAMAPHAALSDAELAAVAGYVARDLNNSESGSPTAQDIAAARAAKPSHKELRDLRERLLK